MADVSVQKLKSDELPDAAFRERRLDGECSEYAQRAVEGIAF